MCSAIVMLEPSSSGNAGRRGGGAQEAAKFLAGPVNSHSLCIFQRVEKERLNALTQTIIGAAIEVHRELGPGLLEQVYEACLAFELLGRGLEIERQKALPLAYKGQRLDFSYRIDLLVEGVVVVSYLRFASCPVGLVFNFNVKWLTDQGLKRVVNGFPE
jgi:GxxExxY protein